MRGNRPKKLPTVRDVAKAAGVSPMTVSRVLSQPQLVAPPTRERVQAALRDLEKAMEDAGVASPEQRTESEALDRKGSDEAAKKLADAMGKALEKLTPEQRKKLAEKLKQRARQGGTQSDPQTTKDWADQLSTPEGQKKLEDELKELADADEDSPESEQQQQLDDADPRHTRGDRLIGPADRIGSVGLGIEQVEVAGRSTVEDQDDGVSLAPGCRAGHRSVPGSPRRN